MLDSADPDLAALIREIKDYHKVAKRDGFVRADEDFINRIIAALTPGGAVVGCHTASESDHDRPPGSERV